MISIIDREKLKCNPSKLHYLWTEFHSSAICGYVADKPLVTITKSVENQVIKAVWLVVNLWFSFKQKTQ